VIEVGAAYFTAWLPLEVNVPVHPSPLTPPVALQEAPGEIFHASVDGDPIGTDVGLAVSETVIGLTPRSGSTNGTPFDVIVRAPVRSPLPAEAKSTATVQVAPACSEVVQPFARMTKFPETATLSMETAVAPEFFTLTD
jgi:hypothetical protein